MNIPREYPLKPIEGIQILKELFSDDPLIKYLNLPEDIKSNILTKYYEGVLNDSKVLSHMEGGVMKGILVYADSRVKNDSNMELNNEEEYLNQITDGRYLSLKKFLLKMNTIENTDIEEKHINLSYIGAVDKGRGIGKNLLAELIKKGDAEKKGIWLYTLDPANRSFYENNGFILTSTAIDEETAIQYWVYKKDYTRSTNSPVERVNNILEGLS